MKTKQLKSPKYLVTIGIPAYQSEDNIAQLLQSLVNQKETGFTINEILVYSDGNTDSTAKFAAGVKDRKKRIQVILGKNRYGMSYGLKYMLNVAKGNIFVLINDDVLIKSTNFIGEMVSPFAKHKNVGLVSGNPQPLPANNFIQKAGISTFKAYERTRYSFRQGQNKMTCDGKALALHRDFWKQIKFPTDNSKLGNVDAYLYFSVLTLGFTYYHARKAVIYYDFPYTSKEYVKWTARNNANKALLRKQFGAIVDLEYKIPAIAHLRSLVIEMLKNPLGAIYIYGIGLIAKNRARSISKNFTPTWEVVSTTKKRLG